MSVVHDLNTIKVLWKRDLMRFIRQRSRLVGALAQPLLFWGMIGGGMTSSFQLQGAGGLDYMEYFYPGILVMLILFAAIFGTISVVEDRNEGFLQSVLAGPGSRAAVVLGKSTGVSSVGLIQAALFLAFIPFAGFTFGGVAWAQLVGMLVFGAVGLSAFGFALAWWINSSQGYHAVMSILLLPAWVMSGAMYPPAADSVILRTIMQFNPMSYLVSGVRRAFYDNPPAAAVMGPNGWVDWAVVVGFAVFSVSWATAVCYRKR